MVVQGDNTKTSLKKYWGNYFFKLSDELPDTTVIITGF